MKARDPVARRLAAAALAVATFALVSAAYAVNLGNCYLEDVRTLGQSLSESPPPSSPLGAPLQLETE